MINRILVLLAIALVCAACADKSTTPDESVQFENKTILSATVAGGSVTSAILSASGTETDGVVMFTISGNGFSGALSLTAYVTGTGTYTLGDGVSDNGHLSLTIIQSPIISYSTQDGATCTLIVDKFDRSVKRVKGRFSGTIKHADDTTKEVKDGVFEGKWD